MGILDDQLLGRVTLSNRLTGRGYNNILVNDLPVLLEHMSLLQETTRVV
jgi:hypothetical protein